MSIALTTKKSKVIDYGQVSNDERFISYLDDGKRIEAIKRCWELTNCSLREAKDYVDNM